MTIFIIVILQYKQEKQSRRPECFCTPQSVQFFFPTLAKNAICSSISLTFLSIQPGMLISHPHSVQMGVVIRKVYSSPFTTFFKSFFWTKYSVSFLHSMQKFLFLFPRIAAPFCV